MATFPKQVIEMTLDSTAFREAMEKASAEIGALEARIASLERKIARGSEIEARLYALEHPPKRPLIRYT